MKKFEVTKVFYDTLSKEIRTIERNFLTLMAALVASLGVYWMGISAYFKKNYVNHNGAEILIIATSLALFILVVIWFLSNVFAYTHRSNQIVLAKIERRYGLCGNVVPKSWCENPNVDMPDIYKFFKAIALLTGLAIVGIDIYLLRYNNILHTVFYVVVAIIVLSLLSLLRFRWKLDSFDIKRIKSYIKKLYIKSYREKLEELKKDYNNNNNKQ
ncbi:MAG: hypothetical protein QXL75_03205 [archaeon]